MQRIGLVRYSLSLLVLGFPLFASAQGQSAPAPGNGQAAPPSGVGTESQPAPPNTTYPNSAPAAAPVPPPGPPPPSGFPPQANPTDACFPPCRAGFICNAGSCISACNPACAVDQVCTEYGTCAVKTELTEHEKSEQRALSMRKRLANRTKPRFTLYGLTSVGGLVRANLMAVGATVAIGYRQNFTETFGLHVRAGLAAGGVMVNDESSSSSSSSTAGSTRQDDTVFGHFYGEFVPYFGPFGRFYFGPLVWYGHFGFQKNTLNSYDDYDRLRKTYEISDSWKGGTGIDMGILLLGREQLDINWRLKSTLNDQIPFWFEMGVGYHFM